MVSINLTLFVELGLFLIFLWGTHRLILKPMLALMDAREERVASDEQKAAEMADRAEQSEAHFLEVMRELRRQTSARIDLARREAMDARMAAVRAKKDAADQIVATERKAIRQLVNAQRERYASLVPGLAEAIANQLAMGRTRS